MDEKRFYDGVVADVHSMMQSQGRSGERGVEALKMELQSKQTQLTSKRMTLENWICILLNKIYGAELNSDLFTPVTKNSNLVLPNDLSSTPRKKHTENTEINTIIFKFWATWPISESLLADLWDKQIFDRELTIELYAKQVDMDPEEVLSRLSKNHLKMSTEITTNHPNNDSNQKEDEQQIATHQKRSRNDDDLSNSDTTTNSNTQSTEGKSNRNKDKKDDPKRNKKKKTHTH
jgi:hypothetical protein